MSAYVFYVCLLRCTLILICVNFVFFFMQNTAYEVRISDWSSDVCSSDLPSSHDELPELYRASQALALPDPFPEPLNHFSSPFVQIGRASCRERVCQYV